MPTEPMLQTNASGEKGFAQAIQLSWIDRLITAITRLPGPSWLFYVVVFIVLVLVNNGLQWLDSTLPVGTFDRARTTDVIFPLYFLALMHYLNACAGHAMQSFRPVTDLPEAEYAHLSHQLQTVPAWPALIAALLGIAFVMRALWAEPTTFGIFPTSSLVTKLFVGVLSAFWGAVLFVFILHTVRQLNWVDRIYRSATRIDLFHLKPVYAFSALTAWAGIGLIFFVYFMIALSVPGVATPSTELTFAFAENFVISGDAISLILVTTLLLIGIAAFVLPLQGIHRRLVEERDHKGAAVALRLNATLEKLHRNLDADQFEQMGGLQNALSALNLERAELNKISTWPWESGTLRGFVTAIFIPILLWLLTRLLENFI